MITNSMSRFSLRQPASSAVLFSVLSILLVSGAFAQAPPKLSASEAAQLQIQSIKNDGVFLEKNGLVVMEAETITLNDEWPIEAIEPDWRGIGYIRYDGPNRWGNPNENKQIAYTFFIEHPGVYRMRMRMQHKTAPEDDLENDVWVKLDDGEFVKAFHPKSRWEEGFGF